MKISNSVELRHLLEQAVLILAGRGPVLFHEELNYTDFEKEINKLSKDIWMSFEAGTLYLGIEAEGFSEAPTDDDFVDYLNHHNGGE